MPTVIRHFKTPGTEASEIPGSRGVRVNLIQIRPGLAARFSQEELERRFQGSPIVLDEPASVMAMTFEPFGALGEQRARFPILIIVTAGSGFVRLGEDAPTAIASGDAVLWPTGALLQISAGAEPMEAIGVEYLNTVPDLAVPAQ